MDEIFIAATNFANLLDKKYRFVIASKGKSTEIELCFQKSDFHHLCGLQYLTDIRYIRRAPREDIFNDIISGKITSEYLKKSSHYTEIEGRIKNAQTLETFLDNTELVFKFLHNGSSRIKFDFMFKSMNSNNNIYLYIIKNGADKYNCNSFYSRDTSLQDTSIYHTRCVLLLKEKIDIRTEHIQELYRAKSYRSEGFGSAGKVENIQSSATSGKYTPIMIGANGVAATCIPMPPIKYENFYLKTIKKFFSEIVSPFETFFAKLRELKATKKEVKLLKEQLERVEKKNVRSLAQYTTAISERDKILTDLKTLQTELQKVSDLSERRGRTIHEVNEILTENPQLKRDYIEAKAKHRKRLAVGRDFSRNAPETHEKPKIRHKR